MGKTSFLVQTAMYAMMAGKNVLHINLSDTVKKTALWYTEVFNLMTAHCGQSGTGFSLPPLLTRRLIMTMKIAGFSIEAVRERLMDFIDQGVFSPQLVVLDGVTFGTSAKETLTALKDLGRELSFGAWLSVPAHREEARDELQRPAGFAAVADLFDVAWELLPAGERILVRALAAGKSAPVDPGLCLNPSTQMLDVV
jgi:hypothetical protein